MLRALLTFATAVSIATSIVGTAVAEGAGGSTPSTAVELTGLPVTGTLIGATGGSFQYYTAQSPSGKGQIALTLTFSPAVEPVANAIGVVAWQNGTRVGAMTGVGYGPGANSAVFSLTAPGPVLLQVYSYYPSAAVDYRLDVAVADFAAPVGPPQPTPTPAPGSASLPTVPSQLVTATLPGNKYGSFDYYQYDYPGDGSTRVLTLTVSPAGADTTNAVFLSVYQSGTLLATKSVRESPTPGVLMLPYSSGKNAPVLVQVANYNFATTITYALANGQ